jgi:hypothetical protein
MEQPRKHTKPPGSAQLHALRVLEQREGFWHVGCGWVLNNASQDARLFDSLVNRGLVAREESERSWRAGGTSFRRIVSVYTITDAGRTLIASVQS